MVLEGDDESNDIGFQDSSRMTFCAQDGSMAETLWNALSFKILQWQLHNDPDNRQLVSDWKTLRKAYATMDDPMADPTVMEVHKRYRPQTVDFLGHEVEDLLCDRFGSIPEFTVDDYDAHCHLQTLREYHLHMRSIYQRVQHFLMEERKAT